MSNSNLLAGGNLKGTTVYTHDHDECGKIKEFMIDPVNGKLVYAIVSFDHSFLDAGENYFAIPWAAFHIDSIEKELLVLDVEKEKLKDAPSNDMYHWPKTSHWDFIDAVYQYYGFGSYSGKRLIGKAHPKRDAF